MHVTLGQAAKQSGLSKSTISRAILLGQAAKQSGLSKSTISRAILQGKQFAVRSADTGSYQIE